MTLYVCCILGPNQKLEFKLLRITEEVLAEDPWLGDASSHASDLVLKGHKSLLLNYGAFTIKLQSEHCCGF